MPNTIEVPISLIKAGDMAAIRELLPKENLFGRWATHPEYGRGIIISAYPDATYLVRFAYENSCFVGGSDWECVNPDDLTLDPVELVTVEDFGGAPEGTVAAEPTGNSFQKVTPEYWESLDDVRYHMEMKNSGPWKILRYGWGD
ncbi:hypothetical protein HMPREF3169_07835 [Corynebacterium sp. HMSC08C04]|uniref:hypothetical protein n=1 Tax=Corynebacterium sp. HMSC08C04 TaxID=1581137 RepID=UPI0008A43903|nr:hypothetical protein [Corynebacterium sp. HMSC08C04]OFT33355.1 hypothetical protein HMPREF3169_07835 [Corynebacterium sp. HMSC08C04]